MNLCLVTILVSHPGLCAHISQWSLFLVSSLLPHLSNLTFSILCVSVCVLVCVCMCVLIIMYMQIFKALPYLAQISELNVINITVCNMSEIVRNHVENYIYY